MSLDLSIFPQGGPPKSVGQGQTSRGQYIGVATSFFFFFFGTRAKIGREIDRVWSRSLWLCVFSGGGGGGGGGLGATTLIVTVNIVLD